MPQDLLQLPGARRANVDGVPVIRVPLASLSIPHETVLALLRSGALIGWRRGWIFAA